MVNTLAPPNESSRRGGETPVSRRAVLFGSAAGVAALFLSGCSPKHDPEQAVTQESKELSESEQIEKELLDAMSTDAARILGYALEQDGVFYYDINTGLSLLDNTDSVGDKIFGKTSKSIARVQYSPNDKWLSLLLLTRDELEGVRDLVRIDFNVPESALKVQEPNGDLAINHIALTLAGEQGDADPYVVESASIITTSEGGESRWGVQRDRNGKLTTTHEESTTTLGDPERGTPEPLTNENLKTATRTLSEGVDRLLAGR